MAALRQYRRFLRLGQNYALKYGDASLRVYIFGVARAEFQLNRGLAAGSPLTEELLALGERTLDFFESPFRSVEGQPPVLSRQDPQYLLLRSIRDGDVFRTGTRMARKFHSTEHALAHHHTRANYQSMVRALALTLDIFLPLPQVQAPFMRRRP